MKICSLLVIIHSENAMHDLNGRQNNHVYGTAALFYQTLSSLTNRLNQKVPRHMPPST